MQRRPRYEARRTHLQVVYVDDSPETELLPTTVVVVPLPKEGDGVTQVGASFGESKGQDKRTRPSPHAQ